jgi:hypothetical protein
LAFAALWVYLESSVVSVCAQSQHLLELGRRVVLERWPEGNETMEFRLVLRGQLPPDRRGTT